MEKKIKVNCPRYQQIALDLASKIVDREYEVGQKIYARSSLASKYNVSSETARRAIAILTDLNIVETTKGSGVVITSYENAIKFVRQYEEIETVYDLKKDILNSMARQKKEIEHLHESLSKLIDRTDRFSSINPFIPYEVTIMPDCPHLEKTISQMYFWHNTLATIVAIRRGGNLTVSPGPYAVLRANDTLYFLGDETCPDRVKTYLSPSNDL